MLGDATALPLVLGLHGEAAGMRLARTEDTIGRDALRIAGRQGRQIDADDADVHAIDALTAPRMAVAGIPGAEPRPRATGRTVTGEARAVGADTGLARVDATIALPRDADRTGLRLIRRDDDIGIEVDVLERGSVIQVERAGDRLVEGVMDADAQRSHEGIGDRERRAEIAARTGAV